MSNAETVSFESLGLRDEVLWGLQDLGFEAPTPIQQQAIPLVLDGKDMIACAQTGTGKTGAFLIPLLDKFTGNPERSIKALILCPTRELAKQIDEQAEGLSYHTGVGSIPVYGGSGGDNWAPQKTALSSGVDIVVATPGRLLQHMSLGYVDFSKLEVLVLDEADRMLDMGFIPDITRIISQLPQVRQTLMFSATMPPKIRELARDILKSPAQINLAVSKPAAGIKQSAYLVHDSQKIDLLDHIFSTREIESMILFASRKTSVDQIERKLKRLGYNAVGIHSDREQAERERILNDFKNRKINILVATDILSRGIDVDNLSHVLNYDVPMDAEDYVHRVGRTARASSTGEAITLINSDDVRKFQRIEKLIEATVPKLELPKELGEGPAYEDNGRRKGGRYGGGGGRHGGGGKFGGRGGGGGKGRGGNEKRSQDTPRHPQGGQDKPAQPAPEGAAKKPALSPHLSAQPPVQGAVPGAEGQARKKKRKKKRKNKNPGAQQGGPQQPASPPPQS